MIVPNKLESPGANLLHGLFLIGFGVFALFVAWSLTKAIGNGLFLTIVLISFIVPALCAFALGIKRLSSFISLCRSANPPQ